MGQVISIALRCLRGEVKRDGVDNDPLISHPQGLSYSIDIYPSHDAVLHQTADASQFIFSSSGSHDRVGDAVATLQAKPLFDMSSSISLTDSDIDHSNVHSSVTENSSISCLDEESGTIYAEEIKAMIVNKHDPTVRIKQVCDVEPENMTKVDFVDGGIIDALKIKEVIITEERRIGPYTSSQKMLLVGEGDFSFSASLAEAFGSAVNILATSLDSKEFLSKNYKGRAMGNISKLTDRGCTVLHGVDCTKMVDLFSSMRFDRIIYNFPHAGFGARDEPRESQLSRHRTLVSQFLANAKKLVKEGGEIHITHKSRGFFRQWDIGSLASDEGLLLLEEVPFSRKDYPGYRTMCGFGGNKFFFCCPSKTYKFGPRP